MERSAVCLRLVRWVVRDEECSVPEASEVGCEGSTVCLRLVRWVVRGVQCA